MNMNYSAELFRFFQLPSQLFNHIIDGRKSHPPIMTQLKAPPKVNKSAKTPAGRINETWHTGIPCFCIVPVGW